ncbi:MAG: hypothetical protein L0Y42_11375, partial [Phycisphaerales bacterium]|nr:hypothetical protein [Phycisphaerales bacterium]
PPTPACPPGMVDRDEACRMFGVSRFVWKRWVREGKVPCGKRIPSSIGGQRTVYAIEDLERMREELFGDDKLYKDSKNQYHVPPGLARRQVAWRMLGVEIKTWERWEREGRIQCGMRVPGGPKLYEIQDIQRLLEEFGRLAPPHPDPQRPGCFRVPLSGHDIRRREAIIDAESLPLIEGGTCAWSMSDKDWFVSFSHPGGPHCTPLRRVIMGITHPRLNVGHINDDPLDCRRENLIVRNNSQLVWTACKRAHINGRPPTSRFKGVFWETWSGKWRARIKAQGKDYSLGRFHDEIDAAEAYDAAARVLFGEHAWLNFPDDCQQEAVKAMPVRAAA